MQVLWNTFLNFQNYYFFAVVVAMYDIVHQVETLYLVYANC